MKVTQNNKWKVSYESEYLFRMKKMSKKLKMPTNIFHIHEKNPEQSYNAIFVNSLPGT